MAKDLIRYDILAQDALRGVVRKVLGEVAKTGLPGEHHFFISFATTAAGVRISSRLLEQYEKEMTIVLQNQFRDLKVDDNGFEVSLAFDGVSEFLAIPFSAVKGFFDPSVQFGLQFDVRQDAVELAADNETATDGPKTSAIGGPSVPGATEKKANANSSDPEETPEGEKVVSLDAFRKKP
ncbi:MAG: hypothetical protein GXP01_06890 [Alphaproteobacteria bacterium]|nr:hypothetical protein [Alphaproteobacteria bacterium]